MSSRRPLRVAVVNDYEIIVAGVAAALEPFRSRAQVVELGTRLPVLSVVDVILFDTFAHGGGRGIAGRGGAGRGIDLADLVSGSHARVVVFSWSTDPGLVRRTLEAGACGYLSKALEPEQIVEGLEHVVAGRLVGPDARVRTRAGAGGGEDAAGHAEADAGTGYAWPGQEVGLTPRESEVVALISQGLSNQGIAERTYLSINSVKTYIRSAYRKIGVRSRSQAIIWSLQQGFEPAASRIVVARRGSG